MQAVCKKEDIAKLLEIAVRISARHHSLPILQCVYLEVKDSNFEIRATNLEIGFIGSIKIEKGENGVVAVSAQTLLQTITLISTPSVTFKTKEETLLIESSQSRAELKTFSAIEFPTITQISTQESSIDGSLFALGIKHVVFSASQSAIKPELGAVNIFQKKPHTLTLVATDSFRLAEKTVSVASFSLNHALLIPQKNALEIARTLEVLNESPTLTITENQIAFSFPSGVYLVSRLIEGNFPDYEQIIPKEYQIHATALRADIEHALRATNVFSNKFLQVSLDIKPSTGTLTFRSENMESGKSEETIRIDGTGSDFTLSFNQQYLMDALPHIGEDSIDLSFAGIGRPLVMTGHGNPNFRYLVMPMNK